MSGVNSLNTSYDAIGNPLSYRDGLTFTWKNGRQLATLSKTGTSASYKYDDSGVRTSKTVNGVTTNYYRAGNLAVGEISTERGLEYILDANGGIYGIYYRSLKSGLQCGDTYYFAYNAQGDVIGLIGSSGRQFASYSYDERGNCTVTALMPDSQGHAVTDPEHVAFANPFRYRGYYFDVESGLYYLQSRYYDPVVGRFINADAKIAGVSDSVQGFNLFAYCFNNPVNMQDENGNWPKWLTGALDIVSGACQVIGGAAIAAAASWTGVGAVAGVAIMLNGAAQMGAGMGKIINDVTQSETLPEDNLIKENFELVGEIVGGEKGREVGGAIYDIADTAADVVTVVGNVNTTVKTAKVVNKVVTAKKVNFQMIKADKFFMDTYYVTTRMNGSLLTTSSFVKQPKGWFRAVDGLSNIIDIFLENGE